MFKRQDFHKLIKSIDRKYDFLYADTTTTEINTIYDYLCSSDHEGTASLINIFSFTDSVIGDYFFKIDKLEQGRSFFIESNERKFSTSLIPDWESLDTEIVNKIHDFDFDYNPEIEVIAPPNIDSKPKSFFEEIRILIDIIRKGQTSTIHEYSLSSKAEIIELFIQIAKKEFLIVNRLFVAVFHRDTYNYAYTLSKEILHDYLNIISTYIENRRLIANKLSNQVHLGHLNSINYEYSYNRYNKTAYHI